MLEVSHSILSVLSQFKIDRSKPRVCIYSDKITTDLFNQEKLVISTLGKTGEIFVTTIKNDKTYEKWLSNIVNASTNVLLDIKELIDINKEVIIILIKDRKNRKNFERKDWL